jgi:hypothetical protein
MHIQSKRMAPLVLAPHLSSTSYIALVFEAEAGFDKNLLTLTHVHLFWVRSQGESIFYQNQVNYIKKASVTQKYPQRLH